MYQIIERRKDESTKLILLSAVFGLAVALQIGQLIINHTLYVFTLIFNLILFVICVISSLALLKYKMEFNGEKILIKVFQTKVVKIKDIDYYAFSQSRIKGVFDIIIFIKGQEIRIRTRYIKELIDAFFTNNIKRIDNLNIRAFNKQALLQRLELIIILFLLVLTMQFIVQFNIYDAQRIESKDIQSALNTYYLLDNKRFAIFPQKTDIIIDEGFVKTKLGMQIYLISKYDDQDFYDELTRLYNPDKIGYRLPKKMDYSQFNYIMIITKSYKTIFEYAYFDKSNNIVAYIYFENTRYDEIAFDKKYLPIEYKYYYNEMIYTLDSYDYYN